MTNLEKATKRIQYLVPDIMELKRGCLVIEDKDLSTVPLEIIAIRNSEVMTLSTKNGYIKSVPKDHFSNCEILGRDISLEDILSAIDKGGTQCKQTAVTEMGQFVAPYSNGAKQEGVIWKLNTPFHLQSEEVIDFVYKLIDNE